MGGAEGGVVGTVGMEVGLGVGARIAMVMGPEEMRE